MAHPNDEELMQAALSHHQTGRLAQAESLYRKILAQSPKHVDALHFLGVIAAGNGRYDEAISLIRRSITLNPSSADAYGNLGKALKADGRLEEAIVAYRQSLVIDPTSPQTLCNLGVALRLNGNSDKAIDAYRRAIVISPELPEAHYNLGNALKDQANFSEAIAAYDRAIALRPNYADAHYNLSSALLLSGDFARGWAEYEWRLKSKQALSRQRNFTQPMWRGQRFPNATLLLHAEQGFGDTIQFIRYLPLAKQRGKNILIECQPGLERLLRTIAGESRIVPQGTPLPPFDLHCPLPSLPGVFGTTLETIPQTIPYLCASEADQEKWRVRLAADSKNKKIGIAWAGNKLHGNDRHRSMPLSAFLPLANLPDFSLYSLQKGEAADQVRSMPAIFHMADFTADLHDFAETAALIANLDLVISVDSAVAHLAGAMGKPTLLLLPFLPDWRWMLNRLASPWYPTTRLFRQDVPGQWDSVIDQVKTFLDEEK